MSRMSLLTSIAETIHDYREGEIAEITPAHVNKWINQFDYNDQLAILEELAHIFNKFYYSRNRVKSCLKNFLIESNAIPCDLSDVNFINIQNSGRSQTELLLIVDEILREEMDLRIDQCGGSNVNVYIDDCVFTGNKFRYDIVPWINSNSFQNNSRLIVYHIAHHSQGYDYAIHHITRAAESKKMSVEVWRHLALNNSKYMDASPDIFWPTRVSGDQNVDAYYSNVSKQCVTKGWKNGCYREFEIKNDSIFTSSVARDLVERAFLKAGAKLVMAAINPAESVRPLGFEKLSSMGFGSIFITYRNISNNCPLAFWYGDMNQKNGPLSLWYPLFPRRTYSDNGNFMKFQQIETDWGDLF